MNCWQFHGMYFDLTELYFSLSYDDIYSSERCEPLWIKREFLNVRGF